jgi:hypothetical protein
MSPVDGKLFLGRATHLSVTPVERPGSALDWMALRALVLFEHDQQGRLLYTREPSQRPAPRFYLGRSRHGNLWRFRVDLDSESVRDLARLAGREGPLPDDGSPPERIQAFRDVLARTAPVTDEYRGPGFRFPEASLAGPARERAAIEVVASNQGLLRDGFEDWLEELPGRSPCFVLPDEDGAMASLCGCARLLPGRGAEAGVETREGRRGKGLAPRVVSAWARAISASGAHPFYSTRWDNRASRAVAAKLGLLLVGEDLHFS